MGTLYEKLTEGDERLIAREIVNIFLRKGVSYNQAERILEQVNEMLRGIPIGCQAQNDSINFTPQDIYGQGHEKNYLYGMIKKPESGNVEIFPMNGDTIIIHGEKEAMFFIQMLIKCLQ